MRSTAPSTFLGFFFINYHWAGKEEKRTTMQRLLPPGRQVRTRRETKWAEEGLLCLLTLEGRAATVAWFRYSGQLSVGLGLNPVRAACQT